MATQRDLKKLEKATKKAQFLYRRGLAKDLRTAAVQALCDVFGKASLEHIQAVLTASEAQTG
jgi:hypothetical protein